MDRAQFGREGLAALESGHGGGQPKRYTQTEQERHPQAGTRREARRAPDRDKDKTATWSLSTLQGALRRAPDGQPEIRTYTIWCVLHDAGFTWDRDRSWCETGTAVRKRKSGTVTVVDPDATAKKLDRSGVHPGRTAGVHRRRGWPLPDDSVSRLPLAPGHHTPEFVLWLFAHGIMPLFTPLGGPYLNMAEAIQRILKRRALDGQHPKTPEQIIEWLEATARGWNREPTPFIWGGKRKARREQAR